MFYIVILHSLGKGGVLDSVNPNSSQYKLVWFLEIIAYCAVNIFALISGYVGYSEKERKYHYSNLLIIWFQVMFYGIAISLVYRLISPGLVSFKDIIAAFFPLKTGYWYFNAYIGLFFLIPVLNAGIRNCSKSTSLKIGALLFLLFSVFETLFSCFDLNRGYSVVWLVILYLLGAIIKKCDVCSLFKSRTAVIGIIACVLLTWLQKIFGIFSLVPGFKISNGFLVSYVSPTIVIIAVFHIILFSRMQFCNILKRVIAFAAPGAFAVYILNNHPLIWANIMDNAFVYLENDHPLVILAHIILFSIIFVAASILIDRLRIFIFEICRLNRLFIKIETISNRFLTKAFKMVLPKAMK